MTPLCLAAFRIGRRWGFINQEGEQVIPPTFSRVSDFEDGYSLVSQGESVFYIDSQGKPLSPIQPHDKLEPFRNGYARVMMDGKWGFIDKKGRCTIRPQYLFASDFEDGIAPVLDHIVNWCFNWKYVDREGNTAFEACPLPFSGRGCSIRDYFAGFHIPDSKTRALNRKTGLIISYGHGRYGFRKPGGEWVIEPRFRALLHFSEGLAPAYVFKNRRMAWGFIDESGRFVIEPDYEEATAFYGGMACVREPNDFRYSLLDRNGRRITGEDYFERLAYLGQGIAIVDACGSADSSMAMWGPDGYIATPRSSYIDDPSEGLIAFGDELSSGPSYRSGYMDMQGRVVIPAVFEYCRPFSCGLAAVEWMGRIGYIDRSGNFVVQPQDFDEAREFKIALPEES